MDESPPHPRQDILPTDLSEMLLESEACLEETDGELDAKEEAMRERQVSITMSSVLLNIKQSSRALRSSITKAWKGKP